MPNDNFLHIIHLPGSGFLSNCKKPLPDLCITELAGTLLRISS